MYSKTILYPLPGMLDIKHYRNNKNDVNRKYEGFCKST